MNGKYLIRKSSGVWWVVPPDSRGFGVWVRTFKQALFVVTAIPDPARTDVFNEQAEPIPSDLVVLLEKLDDVRFPNAWKVTR